MKMTAFWDIAPFSLVEGNRRFRGAYCLNRQADDQSGDHRPGDKDHTFNSSKVLTHFVKI
jgi:hypothetical protein